MQKVAEAASWTIAGLKLAGGFVKVSDRRKLGINRFPIEPAIIHVETGFFSVFFVPKFGIGVSRQMFGHVLTDV